LETGLHCNIVFRVDFGDKVGLGHLKRTLVYAKRFENVLYISKSDQQELLEYPLITIKNEEEFFTHIQKLQPKEIVVDNYNFLLQDEIRVKKLLPDTKLTVFDDDYREHFCDEIINHNLGVKKERYKDPSKVTIIAPLIAKEFIEVKKRRYNKKGIFVSFGGSDPYNMSLKIVKYLKGQQVDLYTTSQNRDLLRLKRYCFLHRNIKLHIDKNIARGMAQSFFGIITPSTMAYEAIYMDLPFLAIQVAKNQDTLVQYLKQKRYTVLDKRLKRILWKKN
jgi:UDP-2,4-diacetamido-2,4,6-trideoxy-beta-L-altropyranose hydrolase